MAPQGRVFLGSGLKKQAGGENEKDAFRKRAAKMYLRQRKKNKILVFQVPVPCCFM
jgi:hypothetical protein